MIHIMIIIMICIMSVGRCDPRISSVYPEHFHHFIAQMIDDLHRNAPGVWFVEGPRGVAVQRGPGFFVDLRLQRGFQRFLWIVRAKKVGGADDPYKALKTT